MVLAGAGESGPGGLGGPGGPGRTRPWPPWRPAQASRLCLAHRLRSGHEPDQGGTGEGVHGGEEGQRDDGAAWLAASRPVERRLDRVLRQVGLP